jgi:triosephosphate isomerase
MRRPLIAGNWKMNGTPSDSAALARDLRAVLHDLPAVDVAVFPPFLSIAAVLDVLKGMPIAVGTQDLHAEDGGAFTGNVAGPMIRDAGCTMVLVGHSERRSFEKEDGVTLAKKTRAALRNHLTPIFCCGETLEDRDSGQTLEVVRTQLREGLSELTATELSRLVIAYEPVWAIGTGRVATPEQAQEVHASIRAWLGTTWDVGVGRAMRILYGGSVKPGNVARIMDQEDIDGALVGGASLKAESFEGIIRFQSSRS